MQGKTRAFIAVDVPSEIRGKIIKSQPDLHCLRATKEEQLHITLEFLGDVTSKELDDVKEILSKINRKRFKVSLVGVGSFVSRDHGVLFVKISDGASELLELNSFIRSGLSGSSIRLEKRGFTPHLTIARISGLGSCKGRLDGYIKDNLDFDFGSFYCDAVRLKESKASIGGHIHSNLMEVQLR